MRAYVLDANVALRFLLADDPEQSPKSRLLFAAAEEGKLRLTLTAVTLAELAWVLTSFFGFPRADVGAKLRGLVLHNGIECEERDLALDALDRFGLTKVDFADCHAAAWGVRHQQPVASYDRDFQKFNDVKVLTPEEILKGRAWA